MRDRQLGLNLIAGATFIYILAPVVVVVIMAFNGAATLEFPPRSFSIKWFGHFFSDRVLFSALLTSLELSLAACLISLALGTGAAFALSRGKMPGKSLVTTLLMTPLMVPGVVLGLSLLQYFALLNAPSFAALLAAHVVITLPYVIRSILAGLAGVDLLAEQAAVSLGATRFQAVRMITFPMLTNSIIAAVLFSFIVSFENLPLALFLSDPTTVTLPMQIYSYIQWVFDPTVAAAATVQIFVVVILVFIAEYTVGLSRFMGALK